MAELGSRTLSPMSGDPAKGLQGAATSTITAVWGLSSWQPGGQEAGAEQASYARGGGHKVKVRTETGVLSPGGTDSAGGRVGDTGTTSRLLTLYQPELREKEGRGLHAILARLPFNPRPTPPLPAPESLGLSTQIRDQGHSSPQNTAQHRSLGPTEAAMRVWQAPQ